MPHSPEEPGIVLERTTGCLRIAHSILGTIEVIGDEVSEDPLDIPPRDSVLDATGNDREAPPPRTAAMPTRSCACTARPSSARCARFHHGHVAAHPAGKGGGKDPGDPSDAKPVPEPKYAPFPGSGFFRIGQISPVVTAMGRRLVTEGGGNCEVRALRGGGTTRRAPARSGPRPTADPAPPGSTSSASRARTRTASPARPAGTG